MMSSGDGDSPTPQSTSMYKTDGITQRSSALGWLLKDYMAFSKLTSLSLSIPIDIFCEA